MSSRMFDRLAALPTRVVMARGQIIMPDDASNAGPSHHRVVARWQAVA
jgi:hypothetical protein